MIKFTLLSIVVALLSVNVAFAKEAEPEMAVPEWATQRCVEQIGRIVQHEVGQMDYEAKLFVSEQIIYDVQEMGCDRLTDSRWAIGYHPEMIVSPEVKVAAWSSILEGPSRGKCQFVGSLRDTAVWKSHGFSVSVDYRHNNGGLTVVGVNCETVPLYY